MLGYLTHYPAVYVWCDPMPVLSAIMSLHRSLRYTQFLGYLPP